MQSETQRPSYIQFIKKQIRNQKTFDVIDGDGKRTYIEKKSTKDLTQAMHMIYIILIISAFHFHILPEGSFLYQFSISIFLIILFYYIVESIHWFYAKFELKKIDE